MNKYTYTWFNTRNSDTNIRIEHSYTTFAENEQEAEDYAKKKIQEFMDEFNTKTSDATKGEAKDIALVSVEEVKIPKPDGNA